MLNIPLDRNELDQVYEDAGLPGTGLPLKELRSGLRAYDAAHKTLPPWRFKSGMFAYLLDHMQIHVSPRDLFVTFGTCGRKIFEEEILWPHRQKELLGDAFPADAARRQELEDAKLVSFAYDYWHSVPDWECLFKLGFPGLLERARTKKLEYKARHGGRLNAKECDFFDAIETELEAVLRLLDRTIQLAERESCQPETVAALKAIRFRHPESFYELMLTDWIYFQISDYAEGIQARSFGNLDQFLWPALKRDWETGALTRDEASTILGNFMLKVQVMKFYWGHPFFIGGTLKDGQSGVNELSRLILEVFGKLGIFDPKIQIKLALNTPTDFIDQALRLIRSGNNSLVFIGEPGVTEAMTRLGYTKEEARTADVKGCYEYSVRGEAVETAPILLKLPNIVLKVMRENPAASDYDTFYQAFQKEMLRCCDDAIVIANHFETKLDAANPSPLFSSLSLRALETAQDGYAKAAKYSNSNVWLLGPATAANSLAMIKKYVFEKKTVTMAEFTAILDRDWLGGELLRTKILNDPFKYGNGDPEADAIMASVVDVLADHVQKRPNGRGGFYTTALHSSSNFLYNGLETEATPDGRHKGEELSKNASVQPGSNLNGVTAMIRSALSLDPPRFAADFPLDVMLHPSAVAGEEGLSAMRALLMGYVAGKGHAIHFNVFSAQHLRDAIKDPEKYADLQVRVCGWNVLWRNLSRAEQESYLRQAEAAERGC